MKVMVTGHRPPRLKGRETLVKQWLYDKLKELKPDECISGMAEGADLFFAEAAAKLGIPFTAYLPFMQKFNKMSQYKIDMMHKASTLYYVGLEWSPQCYVIRDKKMVDDSDVVLVVWDGNPVGGSYITMEYAKKKGKEMYILRVDEGEGN